MSKDRIGEVLSEINECMIDEMNCMLDYIYEKNLTVYLCRTIRSEFLKNGFANFKKDELINLLSISIYAFDSPRYAFKNSNLFYITALNPN